MSSELSRVEHEFPPVYDENSRVLILGTIPSPKSRERGFYYMHPQNRFWKMLSQVLGEPTPHDIPGRRELCLSHGIALWDVLAECSIDGASDSSIRNAVPNQLRNYFRRRISVRCSQPERKRRRSTRGFFRSLRRRYACPLQVRRTGLSPRRKCWRNTVR